MNKSKQLNQWFWKWHIIAGLVCMPVIALLCITGSIYLFKSNFNDYVYQDARFVSAPESAERASYSDQLNAAEAASDHHIMSVALPTSTERSTAFRQHAKAHSVNLIYINPYTNEVSGIYQQQQSLMQTVRKLHGELLLGLPGTLFVELVASWFIVLVLTGIYIWWPAKQFSIKGFFKVRRKQGRRIFWRDMHAVLAFWMSLFMLIILAGGMPWTEVFGDNLKWVQKQTNSGYPQHWRNAKGLKSDIQLASTNSTISLDRVVAIAKDHDLLGEITIKLPQDDSGVYTISNRALWLDDQKVIHVDQYSGAIVKALNWTQVGILMELRQVFMRLHQGEYGKPSLIAVLLVALTFFVATVSSLTSYLIRRPKGEWGLPRAPESFKVGLPVVIIITLLAILFPIFGASVVLIILVSWLTTLIGSRKAI